jgi:hypothetical protein
MDGLIARNVGQRERCDGEVHVPQRFAPVLALDRLEQVAVRQRVGNLKLNLDLVLDDMVRGDYIRPTLA